MSQPTSLHPNDAALHALAEARAASVAAQSCAERLLALELARHDNPQIIMHSLTAADPRAVDRTRERSASIGIYNGNPVVIYTSVGGVTAAPDKGALSVPARSFVVLPLGMQELELGVDPADANLAGGESAIIYLFRWKTVQPAFLGGI